MEQEWNGKTKLFCLIGSPVAHSGSPAMYQRKFQEKGMNGIYLAFDISKDKIKSVVEAMRILHIYGMNVTMPCKEEVCKYLDKLSFEAKIIGAVNTIVWEEGDLVGYNTDGEGFIKNLEEHHVFVKEKKIVLAGLGGAGSSILVKSLMEGAKEITAFQRKGPRMEGWMKKAEMLKKHFPSCELNICDLEDERLLRNKTEKADIFINATSLGMKPHEKESVIKDKSIFHKNLVVADAVYYPEKTKLLKEAEKAGCKIVDGTGMLYHQGEIAFQYFLRAFM